MRRFVIALLFAAGLAGCKPPARGPSPAAVPPPVAPPVRPEEEAWKTIEARNQQMVTSREFGAALRVLDLEAAAWPALADRIAKLKEVVLAAARGEFLMVDRRASRALELQDYDAAIAAWHEAVAFDVPELTEAAQKAIQAAENLRTRRQHEDALPHLGPALIELQKHLLARDDKAAIAMLRRVASERPELRHEMDWLEGTVIESKGIFGCVVQGLAKMKGESVEIGGEASTVAGVDDDAVTFDRPSGSLRLPLAQLPPDFFVQAGLRGSGTADYLGQWLLFTGRIPEARRAFAQVKDRPDLEKLADAVEAALGGEKR